MPQVAVTGGWDLAGEARELMVVMTQLNLSELTGWGVRGNILSKCIQRPRPWVSNSTENRWDRRAIKVAIRGRSGARAEEPCGHGKREWPLTLCPCGSGEKGHDSSKGLRWLSGNWGMGKRLHDAQASGIAAGGWADESPRQGGRLAVEEWEVFCHMAGWTEGCSQTGRMQEAQS